jgi:GAF domain-containing protein
MGLSNRITLLTFVSLTAAAVLVSVISLVGVYRAVLADERTRLEAFRELLASSLDARLGNAERSLDVLASMIGSTPTASPTPSEPEMDELLEARADVFDALALVSDSGDVSSSDDIGPEAPGPVMSALSTAPAGTPVLVWVDGLGEPGRLWAGRKSRESTHTVTLLARVRSEYLVRTLNDVAQSVGSLVALVADRASRPVMSGAGGPTVDVGTIAYSAEGTGAVRGIATARSPALGSLAGAWGLIVPDHGLGWRVVALEAEADALSRAREALTPALLAVVLVLAAAVVLALIYSRRVLAPPTVFEQRARDVAAGGYVRPLRIVRDDEMGRVADAFNDMGVRLNSLQDMAELLASASSLDDELDAVLSAIARIFGTGDCAVLLSDPSGLGLSLARGRGLAAPAATLLVRLDQASPLTSAFAEQRTVPFVGDEPPGSEAIHQLFGADAERAGVVVPLAIGADSIGVVVVLAPGRRQFTAAQVETMRVFSANAAVAVRTSRLFAEERLSRREAEALRSVAELTVRPGDLGRALDGCAAIAAQLLGYSGWAVALEGRQHLGLGMPADPEGDAKLLEVWRLVEAAGRGPETPADAPIVVDDVLARPDLAASTGPGWGSALLIPVLQGGIGRGALVLHDRARMRRPSAGELSVAGTIGQQVSLAIRNVQLLQQARARAANLETVFRISQAVSSELQIGPVLNRVLDVVQKILSADAVALMSYEADRNVIATTMARGLSTGEMLYYQTLPGEDIVGRVFASGLPLSYGDLSERSGPLAQVACAHGFESLLAVPLKARGRPIGVLAVYSHASAAFSGEDVDLLLTFASQAALAIDTAAVYGKEHRVASVLQASILPDRLPVVAGLETASFYLPCGPETEIGGDFYDLFVTECGDVVLAIGDVCGKGVVAATKTSMVKFTLRGLIGAGTGPAAALAELNRQVALAGDPADIVTMWVGILDRHTGVLTYADGGHPPALLLRDDTRRTERLGATGPLLGAVSHAEYGEKKVGLRVGDTLLLYTDGVTEARRGVRLFGEGRVRRVLRRSLTARECLDSLLEAVKTHADGPLKDDAAALAVRRAGSGQDSGRVSGTQEG